MLIPYKIIIKTRVPPAPENKYDFSPIGCEKTEVLPRGFVLPPEDLPSEVAQEILTRTV